MKLCFVISITLVECSRAKPVWDATKDKKGQKALNLTPYVPGMDEYWVTGDQGDR